MKFSTVVCVLSVTLPGCLCLYSPDVRGTSQQLQQEMSPGAVKRLIHFHADERHQDKNMCTLTWPIHNQAMDVIKVHMLLNQSFDCLFLPELLLSAVCPCLG